MKSLLHRLAARATGSATLLRPDLHATLAAAGTGWAAPSDAADVATRPLVGDAHRPPVPAPSDRALHGEATPLPTAEPRQAVHPPLSSVEDQAAPRHFAATAHRPGAGEDAAVAPLVPTPPVLSGVSARDGKSPLARQVPAEASGRSAIDHAADQRRVVSPRRLLPVALPAMRADTATTPSATPGPPPRQAAHGEVAEVPEVHILIGRIEVNAVQEPSPPRRRPVPAQAPMSLDAYLARRSKP